MSEIDYISVKIKRETNQKMKAIATLDGFRTIAQWLEWVVDKGYEATLRNRGRKIQSLLPKE